MYFSGGLVARIKEVSHKNELIIIELVQKRKLPDSFKKCKAITCNLNKREVSKRELELVKDKLNDNLLNLLSEYNTLQALVIESNPTGRINPTSRPLQDATNSKRLMFEKMTKVLNEDNDENMPVITTEADSLLMKNKLIPTFSNHRSKTEIFNITTSLSEPNHNSRLSRVDGTRGQYSGSHCY